MKHIQRPRGETVHQRFREKSQGWLGAEARARGPASRGFRVLAEVKRARLNQINLSLNLAALSFEEAQTKDVCIATLGKLQLTIEQQR